MSRTRQAWSALAAAVLFHAGLLLYTYRVAAPQEIVSPDVPWHLTCGRLITETGAVPRVDPICFTTDGIDWVNLNWLAQVGLYETFQVSGFTGLLGLELALLLGSLALFALTLRSVRVDVLPGLLALALGGVTLLSIQGVRPRAATFVLLLLSAWLLGKPDPEHRLSWRRGGALLLALWLWNHLHGGFVYGYCLLAMDAFATSLQSRWSGGAWLPRRTLILAGVVCLGLLGFAAHPHGFDAVVHAATYTRALDDQLSFIAELQPLDFRSPRGLLVECFLLALGASLYASPRRPDLRAVLVLLPFLHLALVIRRGWVPLVLLGAPVLAWALSELLREPRLRRRLPLLARAQARLRLAWRTLPAVLLSAAAACLVGALLVGRPGRPGELGDVWPGDSVAGAARWLRESQTPGRIYNFYDAGGLLGWALYPERRIYVDGRGDLHARGEVFANYLRVFDAAPGWKEHLDGLGVDLVIMPLPPRQPPYLLRALSQEAGWSVAYADDAYVVLRRPPQQD